MLKSKKFSFLLKSLVAELSFENDPASFRQIGAEAGVRVNPITGLDFYVNYAFHDTSPSDSNVDLKGLEFDELTSAHKINLGVQNRTKFGLDVAADTNIVTDQLWVEQISDPVKGVVFDSFKLDGYIVRSRPTP